MPDPDRVLPAEPVDFIQARVRAGAVFWTYHVAMRLEKRFISRSAILSAVDSYELVESYPEDKYLPSYLVLGQSEEGPFHVLFAADVPGQNVRIVTAYRPSPAEWDQGFRHRRRS